MLFPDRGAAGRGLALLLRRYKDHGAVIYALPRGGVPVAAPIAEALGAPLDLALVRKIGAPFQPELAMGAVADGETPTVSRNEDVIARAGVDDAIFEAACAKESAELARRRRLYLGGRRSIKAKGRIAIVVDDGIATGATTRAALRAIRAGRPSKLILAVPVAPPETLEALRDEADEIVCLYAPPDFIAVGAYYRDFHQIDNAEVIAILASHGVEQPPAAEH